MRALSTFDIEVILKSCHPNISQKLLNIAGKGDLPISLPDDTPLPVALICNNDMYWNPGLHWLLFFFDKKSTLIIDSFGIPISWYNWVFLPRHLNNPILQNTFELQQSGSNACGYYVIYFMVGLTSSHFTNIVERLSYLLKPFKINDKEYNDKFVYHFVQRLIWINSIQIKV